MYLLRSRRGGPAQEWSLARHSIVKDLASCTAGPQVNPAPNPKGWLYKQTLARYGRWSTNGPCFSSSMARGVKRSPWTCAAFTAMAMEQPCARPMIQAIATAISAQWLMLREKGTPGLRQLPAESPGSQTRPPPGLPESPDRPDPLKVGRSAVRSTFAEIRLCSNRRLRSIAFLCLFSLFATHPVLRANDLAALLL